eukprot:TRINITY_DN1094_c0_g1_i3.p1 TRINITY_DN1094_c0_g1~~TRINITY_DN1094_c0_g1_i3.p1  ORF type:complete len:275 (-),score=27.19 TRINITY_DN1094_c0_g1_i3:138-962(-)
MPRWQISPLSERQLLDCQTVTNPMCRHTLTRLSAVSQIPQPVTTLPAIRAPEPRTIIRRSSVAGRSRKASQCDRERLLAELNKAGTGALDKLPGVVVLEVLPSKRCVHFGTVVAGAVQPSTSTVIEAKGGGAELKLGEKARGYALLLAQHAEQISSNDVPCVLRRVARVRRGKREHAYDVVAMQRPSRVPKWIRNPLQGPRQKLEELEEDSEQVCSVCLEGSFHVSCVELACRHKFHQKCIRQWIQKSPEGQSVSCPMCKGEIGEIPHSRTCTR